jgi:hypothetical protein
MNFNKPHGPGFSHEAVYDLIGIFIITTQIVYSIQLD